MIGSVLTAACVSKAAPRVSPKCNSAAFHSPDDLLTGDKAHTLLLLLRGLDTDPRLSVADAIIPDGAHQLMET